MDYPRLVEETQGFVVDSGDAVVVEEDLPKEAKGSDAKKTGHILLRDLKGSN